MTKKRKVTVKKHGEKKTKKDANSLDVGTQSSVATEKSVSELDDASLGHRYVFWGMIVAAILSGIFGIVGVSIASNKAKLHSKSDTENQQHTQTNDSHSKAAKPAHDLLRETGTFAEGKNTNKLPSGKAKITKSPGAEIIQERSPSGHAQFEAEIDGSDDAKIRQSSQNESSTPESSSSQDSRDEQSVAVTASPESIVLIHPQLKLGDAMDDPINSSRLQRYLFSIWNSLEKESSNRREELEKYSKVGSLSGMAEAANELVKEHKNQLLDSLRVSAMVSSLAGKYAESNSFVSKGLKLIPNDFFLRDQRAKNLFQLGRIDEAAAIWNRLLAENTDDLDTVASINAQLAVYAAKNGDLAKAKQLTVQSLARFKKSSNEIGIATQEQYLAVLAAENGDLDLAIEQLPHVIAKYKALIERTPFVAPIKFKLAEAESALGAAHLASGNISLARSFLVSSARSFDELGSGVGLSKQLADLSAISGLRVKFDELTLGGIRYSNPSQLTEDALEYATENHNVPLLAKVYHLLGSMMFIQQPARAVNQFDAAKTMYQLLGDKAKALECEILVALSHQRHGSKIQAKEHFDMAATTIEQLQTNHPKAWKQFLRNSLPTASQFFVQHQELPVAETFFSETAPDLVEGMQNNLYKSSLMGALATHNLSNGMLNEARTLLEEKLALDKSLGHLHGISSTYSLLGQCFFQLGNVSRAIQSYRDGIAFDEKNGMLHGAMLKLLSISYCQRKVNRLDDATESANAALGIASRLQSTVGLETARRYLSVIAGLREASGQGSSQTIEPTKVLSEVGD